MDDRYSGGGMPDREKAETSTRLAQIVANSDSDALKQLLLERLGITSREDLLEKFLDVLEGPAQTQQMGPPHSEMAEGPSNRNVIRTNLSRILEDDGPPPVEEVSDSEEEDIDIGALFKENSDVLVKMLYNNVVGSKANDDPRISLLYALKPFLNERRRQRIEQTAKFVGIASLIQNQIARDKEG